MGRALLTLFLIAFLARAAGAQSPPATSASTEARKLAYVVPGLIEGMIRSLDAPLQPVIRATIDPSLASVNSALAAQLSNLPIPSPASGYRYDFDPTSALREKQSLGPVLAERAETIGRTIFLVPRISITPSTYRRPDLRGFHFAAARSLAGPAGGIAAVLSADTLVHLMFRSSPPIYAGLTPNIDLVCAPAVTSHITVTPNRAPRAQDRAAAWVLPRY